jgi:hypothetical protein
MTEDEVLNLIKMHGSREGLAKMLIGEAEKKRDYNIDNMTVIVIDVRKFLEHNNESL